MDNNKSNLTNDSIPSPASLPPNYIYLQFNDKTSKYNDDYYCDVVAFEMNETEVKIHIIMKSNNTLGQIQDPKSSKLLVESGRLNFKNAEFTKADPNSGYEGYLSYHYNPKLVGNYFFTFGQFGYSTVTLYNSTPVF